MMSGMDHSLYFGRVMHARVRPFRHRFEYRVFSALFDIDRLVDLDRRTRLFSWNRFNLFSFHDRDHGARDGSPLRPWVERMLRNAGIENPPAKIQILCYPRILGYVFNPLTVYYCYDDDDAPLALIYEVSNTFGEDHCYVGRFDLESGTDVFGIQTTRKVFYVSPFIEVTGQYVFRLDRPADRLRLSVQQREDGEARLFTNFSGRRRPVTSGQLFLAFFRYPLMTVKVIAAIHWEAFKLWRKGASYVPRPHKPEHTATEIHPVSGQERGNDPLSLQGGG